MYASLRPAYAKIVTLLLFRKAMKFVEIQAMMMKTAAKFVPVMVVNVKLTSTATKNAKTAPANAYPRNG